MTTFDKIYEIVCTIPSGMVCTYGIIANACGMKNGAKIVGYALHANKKPIEIPCHRVVDRNGNLSKSFVFGGIEVQQSWLIKEGVKVKDGKVDLEKYLFKPGLKNDNN